MIDRIEFSGNRRIRRDTLQARIFTRAGDTYNEETLRRDFQALWNTQFFEDVKLRVEDSADRPNAKIIIFEVRERPVIRRIRYDGIKSVTESDILDRFKERKVGLTVESQFDPTRIKKAEVVLRDLLGEHGRQFAKVTPQYERIAASNAVILVFKVEEGPKVKVGQIHFTGNTAFSDRKLIRAMHHSRPVAIPLYFYYLSVLSKTFDREKLNEDLEVGVRGLYQDNGYFKVVVRDPILKNVDINRAGVPLPLPMVGRKHSKVVNITIPIDEGERYRMGHLNIVSSDPEKSLAIPVAPLKAMFPLKEGDIFAMGKVRDALKNYTKAYGEFGYIDFTAEPDPVIDEEAKRINFTLRFDEQKQFFVRRIDFTGNSTTRDKVIRREIMLDEGVTFNQRYWELSILRLNQLDYFDKIKPEDAEIKRNTKEGNIDINLKLKEKGKQSIGLQGGVSGLAGGFVALTYQTNNFMGLGETLTFSAQFGGLQRVFQFGFTQPYLFDRPISTGFTIYSSRYTFDQAKQAALLYGTQVSLDPNSILNYNQNSTGFTAFASYPMRRFSFARLGLSYGLSKTNISTFNSASNLLFTQLQYRNFSGPTALNGIIASTLTPTLSYSTVNHPLNPTGGKSYFYSFGLSGGPLGGNVNSITNVFEWKFFHPVNKKRNVLGFRTQLSHTTGFGGLDLPPYNRFYMGGENDLRGFDVRAITPITYLPTQSSRTFTYGGVSRTLKTLDYQIAFPGGDLQGVGNFEYRIPIIGQTFQMSLFADAGTNGIINRSGLQLNSVGVSNLNTTFPGADVQNKLPIYPRTNFKLRTSTGVEFIVQLPIIQAPFRIYYSYNPNRLHETLISRPLFYNQEDLDALRHSGLPPGVYDLYIKPQLDFLAANPTRLNFFEPRTTLRFTVSRTF